MPTYSINQDNQIEIDFHRIKPDENTRNKMKAVRIWWNPDKKVWFGPKNDATLAVAQELCGGTINRPVSVKKSVKATPPKDYALKVKIKDIVAADQLQLEIWEKDLRDYVNGVMGEDNSTHSGKAVNQSQESVWMNCFQFIKKHLSVLNPDKQEFELVFEYSLPGTVHERPDVFLLTAGKAISLEFKKKRAPQIKDNKDDVAQAIRYKDWLENHHKVTKERSLIVKSYLVCTHSDAKNGIFRGIEILTKENFGAVINAELEGESKCGFIKEWLASAKTEMPDMLQAMEIMYRDGKIPYISDINEKCLKKILKYIEYAKSKHKKILILMNGVPGAGKTAVGQSIVFEENQDGKANAVYLSGNGPLVEVLQYQINQVADNDHMSENAIQGMKNFKSSYFSNATRVNTKVPEQSIIIFDEAQRAWDEAKLKRGFSEPEGLFDVGERIFKERNYAVLIGLYGNGQVIYDGEETGLLLWKEALNKYREWSVVASDEIVSQMGDIGKRKMADNEVFLPVSLRADFIDCSKWVEQAIHPEWKYGILVSNFAEQNVIRKALPGWNIRYNGENTVANGGYGPWFAGACKRLEKACSVFGNQGLELDCPIVLFGGGYVRQNSQWVPRGNSYDYNKAKYRDIDTIVENNFRVLLTRARKEMILLIPRDPILDETYQYFVDMGMDLL